MNDASTKSRRSRRAALGLGTRLARRELVRRPWRSALVILMVLIPTAAMTVATSYFRTGEWSAAQRKAATFGQTDAQAYLSASESFFPLGEALVPPGPIADADLERLVKGLAPGSRVLVERSTSDSARQGDRRSHLTISELGLNDPLVKGRFGKVRGRLPATADEIVINDALADRLRIGIGDTLRLQRVDRALRVVGTVRTNSSNDPVAYIQALAAPEFDSPLSPNVRVFIDLPEDFPARYGPSGPDLQDRVLGPGTGWSIRLAANQGRANDSGVFWSYVGGGVALVVVGTIIAAAFAVGARRQLRTLGLLSSSGASPPVLRWFLATQGAVSGLVGSTVGIFVGVVVARATPHRFLSEMAGHGVAGATIRLTDLLPILVLGVTAAAVAAWLPARAIASVPTLQALAGRPPLSGVPAHLPLRGAALIGAGCAFFAFSVGVGTNAFALLAVVAAVLVLMGTVAIAPWAIAALEMACARFPRSWRLAARSLARNRARSSAVVGAVCAISAAVIAVSTLHNSYAIRDQTGRSQLPYLRPNQLLLSSFSGFAPSPSPLLEAPTAPTVVPRSRESILAEVKQILPKARSVELHWVTTITTPGATSSGPSAVVALATPELLDLLDVPSRLRHALDRGEAIAVVEGPQKPTRFHLTLPEGAGQLDLPLGGSFGSAAAADALPRALLGPAALERYGLGSRPSGLDLVQSPIPARGGQRRAIQRLSEDLAWEQDLGSSDGRSIYLQLPPESEPLSQTTTKSILLALSLLLVVAVVAAGLGLAARDAEGERQVLSAVGTPPRTLRRIGALRAVLLVLTSTAIAVPAALLPSAAIIAALNADPFRRDFPFRPDLWALVFVVAVLPVVVGLAALAGGRLRDAVRPARPKSFTFAD